MIGSWHGRYRQRFRKDWDDFAVDWFFKKSFCDLCAWLHKPVAPKSYDPSDW